MQNLSVFANMPHILYSELKTYLHNLKGMDDQGLPQAILIFGDELLYKTALKIIVNEVVPAEKQAVNFESVDGIAENVFSVVEKVNTYSFFSGTKIVAFEDTKIFYTKTNAADILLKTKDAYAEKDLKAASRFFYSFLSVLNLTMDDVSDKTYVRLNLDMDEMGDTAWLDGLVDHCLENPVQKNASEDLSDIILKAVERGFPGANHLIMTADMVDKRKNLYKAFEEKGLVIDCSVPRGESWADKKAQEALLGDHLKKILAQYGKTMERDAFQALVEITGFDLRQFSVNLEKLIQYSGSRKSITVDALSVLSRSRQDPIFEITGALCDRNFEKSLFYLKSVLSRGFFPLQIIAAIANQIRKLLVIKDFLESPAGRFWHSDLTFDQFKKQFTEKILPVLKAHDRILVDRLDQWEKQLHFDSESVEKPAEKKEQKHARSEKKSANPRSDILLSKQLVNPYPVYSLMKKAERFSIKELIEAIRSLDQANLSLKSSSLNPEYILEKMILDICKEGNDRT